MGWSTATRSGSSATTPRTWASRAAPSSSATAAEKSEERPTIFQYSCGAVRTIVFSVEEEESMKKCQHAGRGDARVCYLQIFPQYSKPVNESYIDFLEIFQ